MVRFLSVSRLFLWTMWLMYRERRRAIDFVASLAGGTFLLTNAHQFIAGWLCFGLAGFITLGVFWRF